MTDSWAQLDSTARRIKVSGIQKMDLKDTRFAVKSLDSRDKRHRKVTYRAFLREVLERTKSPGAVLCCAVAFKQSGVSKLKKEGRETLLNRMKPNIQIFKDLDSIGTENGIRCPTHLELEPTRALLISQKEKSTFVTLRMHLWKGSRNCSLQGSVVQSAGTGLGTE
jgi:hypothetical protein